MINKQYYLYKMNIIILNISSILLFSAVFFLTYLFFPELTNNSYEAFGDMGIFLLPVLLSYFILHELFHAAGYIIHGANYKKITFGMEIEKGVLFCLCKQDITKKNFLFASMYPLFFIGIVTYIISIIFNYPILLFLSILNISGAIGDIVYFAFISRLNKNIMFSELDDGTSFAILSEEDISKKKPFGLNYIETNEKISRKDFKLIKISKLSWIVLILCVGSIIYYLFK